MTRIAMRDASEVDVGGNVRKGSSQVERELGKGAEFVVEDPLKASVTQYQ